MIRKLLTKSDLHDFQVFDPEQDDGTNSAFS
jgi:hypothetical protein